jgi:transcriptional regulator with XRE-family HTH domain
MVTTPSPTLKTLREAAALTQVELANRAGIARSTLARVEAGEGGIRSSTIRALVLVLASRFNQDATRLTSRELNEYADAFAVDSEWLEIVLTDP